MTDLPDFFRGANLIQPFDSRDIEPSTYSLEDALAEKFGGDPSNFTPDVQDFHAQIDQLLRDGGNVCLISPEPMPEGHMFSGYHEMRILTAVIEDPIERIVYLSHEQLELSRQGGGLRLPREGLFVETTEQPQ